MAFLLKVVMARYTVAACALSLVAILLSGVSIADEVSLEFDEGSGEVALDSSGSGNDGVLLEGAQYSADTYSGTGYSVELDGSGDRVELGPVNPQGEGLTLSLRFKADSYPGGTREPRLITKASRYALNSHVFMLSTVGVGSEVRLRFRVRVSGVTHTLRADAGFGLETDVWYHAAATYDGETARLYLDGVEVGSLEIAGVLDNDPSVNVTVGSHSQGNGNFFFDGKLDEVKILERALSGSEINQLIAPTDLPLSTADSYQTIEDNILVVQASEGVLSNDEDVTLPIDLEAEIFTPPVNGQLDLNADGSFSYTPNENVSGTDTFQYKVIDGVTGGSAIETVVVEVLAENDAPEGIGDTFTTSMNQLLEGNVLSNDVDIDSEELTVSLVAGVVSGELNLQSDGSFTYEPDADYIGADGFSYVVSDGELESSEVTVLLSVEEALAVDGSLLYLGFDDALNPGEDLSGKGNDGVVTEAEYVEESGDGSAGSLRFNGTGSRVDVGALDVAGSGITVSAWVKADTFPGRLQDPRIVSKASGYATSRHIFMLSTVKAGSETRLRARLKVGGVTYLLRGDPGSGLLRNRWYHTAFTYDGTELLLYLDGEEVGQMSLTGVVAVDPGVSVSIGSQPGGGAEFDGLIDEVRIYERGLSAEEIEELSSVTPVLVAEAVNDSYEVSEDQQLTVALQGGVLSNDENVEEGETVEVLVEPSNGLLTMAEDGSFTYAPNEDYFGVDSFEYGQLISGKSATVSVNVLSVNDDPLSQDDAYETESGEELTGNVLENDTDKEGDDLTVSLLDSVEHGELELQSDGQFVYQSEGTYSGADSFRYEIEDSEGGKSLPATVEITVTEPQTGDVDLLVHLPLDDGLDPATDASGNGNNGVLAGGAQYDSESVDGSASSLRVNGDGGRLDLGSVDVSGSGLTLAAWIKADAHIGRVRDSRIISKASGTAPDSHVFMLSTIASGAETRLRMRVRVGGTTTTLISDSGDVEEGRWHHAAATYDGSEMRLYLDGRLVGSESLVGAVDIAPEVELSVGSQPGGGQSFNGLIDDVRVLQRAMSLTDIQAVVVAGQADLAPLVPVNLDGVALVPTRVDLVWNTPASGALISDYEIRRGGVLLGIEGGNGWVDTVDAGSTHSFEVRSIGFNGVYSEPVSVIVNSPAVSPPGTRSTYGAIQSQAPAEFNLQNDEEYLAEFLRQNVGAHWWLQNVEEQYIEVASEPELSGNVIFVSPGGGDDTQLLVDALQAAGPNGTVSGDGQSFKVQELLINVVGVTLTNIVLQPLLPEGSYLVQIDAADISLINVELDLLDRNFRMGLWLTDKADRFKLVSSRIANLQSTSPATATLIRIYQGVEDVYIVGNLFEKIRGTLEGGAVRGIWWSGPDRDEVPPGGGVIAGNHFRDLQAASFGGNADGFVAQGFFGNNQFAQTVLFIANSGVDSGKRFVKLQSGGVEMYGNHSWWKTPVGAMGLRKTRGHFGIQYVSNVKMKNNTARTDFSGDRAESHFVLIGNHFWPGEFEVVNNTVTHNHYVFNEQPSENRKSYVFIVLDYDGDEFIGWPLSSAVSNNVISGDGVISYGYWFRNGDEIVASPDPFGLSFDHENNTFLIELERTYREFTAVEQIPDSE